MAQLEQANFLSEVFWVVTIFYIFYLCVYKFIIPQLCRFMKLRKGYEKTLHNNVKKYEEEIEKISKQRSFLVKTYLKQQRLYLQETKNLLEKIYNDAKINNNNK